MSNFLCYVVMALIVSCANGLYIRNPAHEEKPFKSVLDSWNDYKQKIISEISASKPHNFNELEVLEMIPLIIGQYRLNQIKEEDENVLSQVYGSLWPIIVQEANRNTVDDLDPMLSSILQAYRGSSQALNEITLDPSMTLDINTDDHPSQRVLKTVARLMRHDSDNAKPTTVSKPKSQRRPSVAKKDTFDLSLTNIPIKLISRSRRNVEIRVNSEDMSTASVESLMNMYMERNGIEMADDSEDYDNQSSEMDSESASDTQSESDTETSSLLPYRLYEEADMPILSGNFASFQDLIIRARQNRLRNGADDTNEE